MLFPFVAHAHIPPPPTEKHKNRIDKLFLSAFHYVIEHVKYIIAYISYKNDDNLYCTSSVNLRSLSLSRTSPLPLHLQRFPFTELCHLTDSFKSRNLA